MRKIAEGLHEGMTVDRYYDLGVALGFTFQELDFIAYKKPQHRVEAFLDMLFRWRDTALSKKNGGKMLHDIVKSTDAATPLPFKGEARF